eukprot:jgi/Chlat1/135/Chrsp1S03228
MAALTPACSTSSVSTPALLPSSACQQRLRRRSQRRRRRAHLGQAAAAAGDRHDREAATDGAAAALAWPKPARTFMTSPAPMYSQFLGWALAMGAAGAAGLTAAKPAHLLPAASRRTEKSFVVRASSTPSSSSSSSSPSSSSSSPSTSSSPGDALRSLPLRRDPPATRRLPAPPAGATPPGENGALAVAGPPPTPPPSPPNPPAPPPQRRTRRSGVDIEEVRRSIERLEGKDRVVRATLKELADAMAAFGQENGTAAAPASSSSNSSNSSSTDVSLSLSPSNASTGNGASTSASASASVSGQGVDVASTAEENLNEEEEDVVCVVTHPGAESCTKTIIATDLANRTAMVTMTTTVHMQDIDGVASAMTARDFVALAAQGLAEAALELKESRSQDFGGVRKEILQLHEGIVNVLAKGKVISTKPNEPPSNFGHESFICELEDKSTGKVLKALFKPTIEGHADGWHRAPIEWVAYELNLLLGMDYVPPVAYRRGGISVCGRTFEQGAFIYYAPNCRPLNRVHPDNWGVPVERLLSDTRILDVLLNNSDRHAGHFLLGEHWATGAMSAILIDHAAGFRKEAVVNMTHENAFETGPVRSVSAQTYLRLRFLDATTIRHRFASVLSEREMKSMLARRKLVLDYLDELVESKGYNETVLS